MRQTPASRSHQEKSRRGSCAAEAQVPALAIFGRSASPRAGEFPARFARPRDSPEVALPALCPGSGSVPLVCQRVLTRWSRNLVKSLSFNFCGLSSASPVAGGSAERKVRDEHHVRGHTAHRFYLRVHGSSRRGWERLLLWRLISPHGNDPRPGDSRATQGVVASLACLGLGWGGGAALICSRESEPLGNRSGRGSVESCSGSMLVNIKQKVEIPPYPTVTTSNSLLWPSQTFFY